MHTCKHTHLSKCSNMHVHMYTNTHTILIIYVHSIYHYWYKYIVCSGIPLMTHARTHAHTRCHAHTHTNKCKQMHTHTILTTGFSHAVTDRCMLGNHGCQHKCINIGSHGDFRCECNDGYNLTSDNRTCQGVSTRLVKFAK